VVGIPSMALVIPRTTGVFGALRAAVVMIAVKVRAQSQRTTAFTSLVAATRQAAAGTAGMPSKWVPRG
jgi:hypothetical protein